jgi:hypothetical protein
MIVWSVFCAAFSRAEPLAVPALAPEAPAKAIPAAAIEANKTVLIGDFLLVVASRKKLADS